MKIEILLFRSVKTGCFVKYNAYYVLHFVSAIILRNTKNIYKKYINAIFFQIDQHLKMLMKKYEGVPILWNTV